MARLIFATVIVLYLAVTGLAEDFKPAVGMKFTPKSDMMTVSSTLYLNDLEKAVRAEDDAGLEKMHKDGQLVLATKDNVLLVLEVVSNKFITKHEFAECRLLKDGKALSKVYVQTVFLKKEMLVEKK